MLSNALARHSFRLALSNRAAAKSQLLAAAAVSPSHKTQLSTTAVRASGDHVKLWTAERAVSAIMIPGHHN